MKKLEKFSLLKRLSILTGVLALFSLCLIVKPNKVEKVSAISTSIPDLENYTPYEIYDGSFYFDWSYITYDVSQSSNSSRGIKREYVNPSNLGGLVWFDEYANNFYFDTRYLGTYNVDFIVARGQYTEEFHSMNINYNNGTGYIYFFYGTNGTGTSELAYNSSTTNGWTHTRYTTICFTDGYVTGASDSNLISILSANGRFFSIGEVPTLVNNIANLNNQVISLSNQVSSLEGDVSTLNNQITSLNNQITSLNNQIADLNRQLNNAIVNARSDTYVVSINAVLNYEFQIFVNVDYQSNQDFYVKPIKISCNSRFEVFDTSSSLVEYHNNVVDVLDFSEVDVYYYNYSDLYNYLYIDIGDDWLLNIPYVDNDDLSTFSLTNINYYISNWLLDYKSDLSYSGFDYSRSTFVNYNNLISGALGGTNMAYLDGYYAGIDEGYLQGKQDGYSQGVTDGYESGLAVNPTIVTIFSGILQIAMVPVNFFLAIFNFEILGINLSGFIRALFTIAITVIVIRTIFGGKGASE